MKLKTNLYTGIGLRIPYNRTEPFYLLFDNLFNEYLTFDKWEFFLLDFHSSNILEKRISVAKKHFSDTFIVEYACPSNTIKNTILADRGKLVAIAVLESLYLFYEHYNQDIREIDLIKGFLIDSEDIYNLRTYSPK